MTYIPRHKVIDLIPNKYKAIKVAAMEARRLNERAKILGLSLPGKITTLAVERLLDGKISYFDARERAKKLQEEMAEEAE